MREDQLERSLRASAPPVTTAGVLERVADKRARRRTARRMQLGAVAALLVAALTTVVVLARDDADVARVAAPADTPTARVITGNAATRPHATTSAPVPITLEPDQGYVRGPLALTGDILSLAAYDHSGSTFTFPPSRIVLIDTRSYTEESRTDLKAEIMSIADGEGARWVVTRNQKPASGLPDAFLKRIGTDGTVRSALLPFGTDPVGPVVVGRGSVWIPVRDGVLRADPATGRVVERVELAPASSRAVVVAGGATWATDGDRVRVIGAGESGVQEPVRGTAIGLVSSGLRAPTPLTVDRATGRSSLGGLELPSGFTATRVASADDLVWVEGTVNDQPAAVLLEPLGQSVRATVILEGGHDASFAWVRPNTLLAVSNGELLRVDVSP
jgi:hypothetical protein